MVIIESIRIALRSLSANKLRASLTMLGIIIGVSAVITLMGIGRGFQATVTSQIQGIGTNLLFISPGSTQQGGVSQGAGTAQTLTYADSLALNDAELAPAVAKVAAEYGEMTQAVYQGQNTRARITGTTPDYPAVRNVSIAEGEWFNESQVTARSSVIVLGPTTASNLFGDADPVGQQVKLNGIPFRVIGVTASKGGSGFGNQDDVIYAPITTVNARLSRASGTGGQVRVSTINVQVVSEQEMQSAIQQISDILRQRHRITSGDDDFRIISQEDILATLTTITSAITLFLGSIAAISLVVGGIGIMNIMLVSVTERTREIGIRKAVGAQRRDILVQFLAEAIVLSVTGGMIGILIGYGLSQLVTTLTANTSTVIKAVVDVNAVTLATVFSTLIGLVFGVYPAYRAASLNPIEALRYE